MYTDQNVHTSTLTCLSRSFRATLIEFLNLAADLIGLEIQIVCTVGADLALTT
jgi:hypothetical protein